MICPGADANFGGILLLEATWVFGLLIVPTLCMGALMPLVCRLYPAQLLWKPPGLRPGCEYRVVNDDETSP